MLWALGRPRFAPSLVCSSIHDPCGTVLLEALRHTAAPGLPPAEEQVLQVLGTARAAQTDTVAVCTGPCIQQVSAAEILRAAHRPLTEWTAALVLMVRSQPYTQAE